MRARAEITGKYARVYTRASKKDKGRIREPHDDAGQQRSRDPDGGARRVHGVGNAEETIDEDPDPPGAEHDDDEDQEAGPGTHRGDAIGRACFTHAHTVKCDYSILQV